MWRAARARAVSYHSMVNTDNNNSRWDSVLFICTRVWLQPVGFRVIPSVVRREESFVFFFFSFFKTIWLFCFQSVPPISVPERTISKQWPSSPVEHTLNGFISVRQPPTDAEYPVGILFRSFRTRRDQCCRVSFFIRPSVRRPYFIFG